MTKQEQTKQMLKILCDKFQCSAIDRSYMAKSCRQCEDIVEALHEAGYGNISEYKAEREMLGSQIKVLKQRLNNKYVEIEQLKEENEALKNDLINSEGNLNHITAEFKQLQTNAEILAQGVRDFNRENYELTEKVKQTQIDVLNKVKEQLFFGVSLGFLRLYIDKLIEEVQND